MKFITGTKMTKLYAVYEGKVRSSITISINDPYTRFLSSFGVPAKLIEIDLYSKVSTIGYARLEM